MTHAHPDTLAALEPLVANPDRSAVLLDVDGTLAPIADRPEDAVVPAEATAILNDLAARYALVACVTGRQALEAREMVGVPALTYVGNQGFELLAPGGRAPATDDAAAGRERATSAFLAGLEWERLDQLGLRREDKGPIQVIHWRGAPDETAAAEEVEAIEREASAAGLVPLWGRKVLELRPVAGIDKGSAVRGLLAERGPFGAALFVGDDRTDVDAFRALGALVSSSQLGTAVRVGVVSPESPPEVEAEADIVVSGTAGVLEVLEALAG